MMKVIRVRISFSFRISVGLTGCVIEINGYSLRGTRRSASLDPSLLFMHDPSVDLPSPRAMVGAIME